MKLWGLIAAVLLLLALTACTHEPPEYESKYTPPPPPPPVSAIALIGDSFTAGSPAGGAPGSPTNWVNRVRIALHDQGVQTATEVAATGGTGYISNGKKSQPWPFIEQARKVVGPYQKLVILFGSRNDSSTEPEALQARVQETLTEVRRLAPSTPILMIGPVWPNPTPSLAVQANRDILKTQAEAFGATFIDPIADQWFWDRPDLIGPDTVHPTDEGHGYMADRITPVAAELLKSSSGTTDPVHR